MKLTLSTRNVPIGELHNKYIEYGLELDVKEEEMVIMEWKNA